MPCFPAKAACFCCVVLRIVGMSLTLVWSIAACNMVDMFHVLDDVVLVVMSHFGNDIPYVQCSHRDFKLVNEQRVLRSWQRLYQDTICQHWWYFEQRTL